MIRHVNRGHAEPGPTTHPEVAHAPATAEAQRGDPVAVVELFTSEGCSSCPPADELLSEIIHEAAEQNLPVFVLGFHVDYWDFQGWPDRFATGENTARQTIYAGMLGTGNLYTPEMVINGVDELVGSRRNQAWKSINRALEYRSPAAITATVRRVSGPTTLLVVDYEVESGPTGAVVNVAVVESGLEVKVEAGENAGWTLRHDNTVRAFETAPLIDGHGNVVLEPPADLDPAKSAVIAYVQVGHSGQIVAAVSTNVPSASAS